MKILYEKRYRLFNWKISEHSTLQREKKEKYIKKTTSTSNGISIVYFTEVKLN